jgi:pimeloyl-ACP methyl ester carboxylesterase
MIDWCNMQNKEPRRIAGLSVFVFAAILAACTPRLPGDSDAALALEDIIAGFGGSRLKDQTPRPERRAIDFNIEGRTYQGDLYISSQASRAGIVLVPGVVPQGKDDSRIVALAQTLARLQFVVLVPDLRGPRHYRLRAHDVREVADAFQHLNSLNNLVPLDRVGIAGFSYGAGPVLLAALEPDIRDEVDFVVTLGGYYNLHTIITYFTTGYFKTEPDGDWQYLQPSPYNKWVFTLSNADLFERRGDRTSLRALAHEGLEYGETASAVSSANLSSEAQAFHRLITNEDPNRVPELIQQLPASILTELEGLNPASRDLTTLRAEVILVHGRSDTMIPFSESLALTQALPPEQVRLFVIDGLVHVDVRIKRQDIPQLLGAMEALLAQREHRRN